ncbi:14261_t:CDS:2 [Dentiscutata heterogama]|uniref:14261_t:CDS:1 n=1 Tax=Dentiscutata heterogama TaxID=1316150 RepID=A0ACA9KZ57_9GLOM|nr:14261_t:CDS:2 [Dentiscutata heterogama]
MNEICEIVTSQKEKDKLNIHGYLTSHKDVVKLISNIKQQAKNTRDKPSQIIQNNFANISEGIIPYILSYEAFCSTIKRTRRTESTLEPKSLDEIDIPTSLCFTLTGDLFFLKNAIVDQEGYLLFSMIKNIQYLSQAMFWLMDGTFKTVPKLFYQLYTIHAPVGATNLNEIAEENNIVLNLSIIITDFECASINASHNEFPNITNKCCFFHLGQSGWHKIQKVGLANQYGDDDNFISQLHIGVYTIIQEFQKEQQFVELEVKKIILVDPPPKRRQQIINQEQRIMEIVNNHTNLIVMNYLRRIAYNFFL